MWRVYTKAKTPFPVLDSDPVINYQIMEALAAKGAKEEEEAYKAAQEDSKKNEWREKTTEELKQQFG